MTYTIKPLSPDTAKVFVEYLEGLDFHHAPHWSGCFCRFYHTNCSFEQWKGRKGEENKQEALEQIRLGNMKGYLAFDGEKCIGWCNANNICQYKRLESYAQPLVGDRKVGCTICYVIHPEYRKQGVARLLLRQAISDFKEEGYDAVVGLPIAAAEMPEMLYRGTLNMYKDSGFEEIQKNDDMSIMWLEL